MSELLSKGLDLFASGDLRGAARLWLKAKADDPSNSQLDAYLRHVQTLDPAAFSEVEQELAGGGTEPAASDAVATEPVVAEAVQPIAPEPVAAEAAQPIAPEPVATEAVETPTVEPATPVEPAPANMDAAGAAMAAMGFSAPVEQPEPAGAEPDTVADAPAPPPVEAETALDPEADAEFRGEAISDFELLPRRLPPAQSSKHVPRSQVEAPSSEPAFEASVPDGDADSMIPTLPPRREPDVAVGQIHTPAPPVAAPVEVVGPPPSAPAPASGTGNPLAEPVPPPPELGFHGMPGAPAETPAVAEEPEIEPEAIPAAAVSGDILPAPGPLDREDTPPAEDTVITQAPPPAAEPVIADAPPPVEDTVISQAPPPAAEPVMVDAPPPVEDTVITQAPPPAAEPVMVDAPPPVEDTVITQAPPPATEPVITAAPPPVEDTVITQAPPPATEPVITAAPPPAAEPVMVDAPPPVEDTVITQAPSPEALQETSDELSYPAAVESEDSFFDLPPPAAAPSAAPTAAPVPASDLPPGPDSGPWASEPEEAPTQDVSSSGSGLALVEGVGQEAQSATQESLEQVAPNKLEELELRLKELDELDDFTGALEVSRIILGQQPEHQRAREVQQRAEEMLQKMYASKLGQVEAVPKVLLSPEELIWLDLDHRSGFVLAQIDGISSFEDIVELTGMDPLESYRILAKLVQDGVIGAG